MTDQRPHLLGMLPEALRTHLQAAGVACTDKLARRAVARAIGDGVTDLSGVSLPRKLRQAVSAHTRCTALQVVERAASARDGFVKYLLRAPDGAVSEAVRIPLDKPGRFSVCLSSQVGCAMACQFCATGKLGLSRNLAAWEMVAAMMAVREDCRRDGGRISSAVFMGQGEPLHNYDEVIEAARILSHPCGGRVAARNITISTVGLVPQIRRYTREGHRYRLIVSLTSARPDRRKRLLPVAGGFDLGELAAALRDHAIARHTRVTIAWVLMAGVNTDGSEVRALARLLEGIPLRINLIDLNDVDDDAFVRADDRERNQFIDALQALAMPVVRRYSGGADQYAACGMLHNARA